MEKVTNAMLVYQAGMANVFAVNSITTAPADRNARRLLQCDFRSCEWYANGLLAAGATVATAACNTAGDTADIEWSFDLLDQPFSSDFRPVAGGEVHYYEYNGVVQATFWPMTRFAAETEEIPVGVGCDKDEALAELQRSASNLLNKFAVRQG